jgi:SAM-dependent methyltransferase
MAIRPAVERLVAVGYGLTYDLIFRSFRPYHALVREVLECAARSLEARPEPVAPRVLELGCGTGNFSLALGERGYSVVGEDPYGPLVARARRKAEARRLSNVTFRPGPGADGGYDLTLSVHVLYAHPDPVRELARTFSRLRQGGHAIVINFAERAPVVATAREVWSRQGAGAALNSLLWLVPNALFDLLRGRGQSYYWKATEFQACLEDVGFEVLQIRPTFLNGISLLAWCQRKTEESEE